MALLRVLQRAGCVVPVLAAWAFSYWSRRRLKLDFVDCDIMGDRPIGTSCAEHWLMPSLWTPYFYGSVYARAAEIRHNGSTPVLIHIGAADFGLDLRMYWPLVDALRPLDPRLVLIEPQTRLLPTLKERAALLRLGEARLAIVNKAVAPDCFKRDMRMYCWSERLQELFAREVPLDVFLTHERDHLLRAAKGAAKDPENYWSSDFARVAHLPNLTDYIEELRFECITAADLLAETGFAARDVAAMVIDAEGLDNKILDQFLRMPGFQPALVMHETPVQDRTFQQLLWRPLKKRGYIVGATMNRMNVVSVHERLFRWPWREWLLRWLRPFVPCDAQTCEPARRIFSFK